MSFHRQIFGQRYNSGNHNTLIGGVSGTINTPLSLAGTLNINVSRITDFSVVGSDIFCNISGIYNIPNQAFEENTDITYYDDSSDGLVIQLGRGCFRACTNLLYVNFPNGYVFGGGTQSWDGHFRDCTVLNSALLGGVGTTLSYFCFQNTPSLLNFDTINYQRLDAGCFGGTCGIEDEYLNFDNVITVNGSPFSTSTKNRGVITFPALQNMNRVTFNDLRCTHLLCPNLSNNLSSNKASFMAQMVNLELFDAKKLGYIGDPANDLVNTFDNLKMGCVLKLHVDLATANAGTPDISLIKIKTTRAATVEFYDSSGNYVSTL